MKLLFWCIAFLLFRVFFANAQELVNKNDTLKMSLIEVWEKAEENSRVVQMSEKTSEICHEEYQDARMERLPELGLQGSAEHASNIPIYVNGLFRTPVQHEVIHNLYKVSGDMYLNIYNGNKINLAIKENKALYELAQIEQNKTLAQIRYESAALYFVLQKSYVFYQLVLKDIANQQKQLEEIKSMYKNGIILKSDVLRVELDLSKREMLLVTIQNDMLIANQKLNIIMGIPDAQIVFPIDETDPRAYSGISYNSCLESALSNSFDYHISEKNTQISDINLRQIKANYRPKIGLYGEYYFMNPQIFLYPYNPYWYSLGIIGLRVSYPISSLYLNYHKKKAAELELEKEEIAHKNTEDNVRQQVNEAYLRYKEALVQIHVSEVNVNQALENARIIKDAYFKQTSLITDLLDADIQVLQTKFELEAAKMNAQVKYYLLQNILGTI
jgi:outer membrane protein TolC